MHRLPALLLGLSLPLALGCDGEGPRTTRDGAIDIDLGDAGPGGDEGGMCAERRTTLIYYGTAAPTELPLTPGQVLAVGTWGGCTGTFTADEWVVTARHCGVRPGDQFCVGTDRSRPNVCFRAAEVYAHSSVDLALVRMDGRASERIPALEPVPIMTERVDDTWVGTTVEAAGYGVQEDGSSGEREFAAMPLAGLDRQGYAISDGQGTRGVCSGDSGGPLFILASDSTVRILGTLLGGDTSCVGQDRWSRTDLQVAWIEGYTGPTVATGGACGRITAEGDCMGSTAVFCGEDGVLASERCEGGATCGWDREAAAYRCITEADPCGGITAAGICDGQVATWCERGVVRRRDCGACDGEGFTCQNVSELGGAYCDADPCDGIDYLGECQGDVAVWCQDGAIQTRDCARQGLRCGYIDDTTGYFCGR